MTKREFFVEVSKAFNEGTEIYDYCLEQIQDLDTAQARSRAKRAEKHARENTPIMLAIQNVLKEIPEGLVVSEIHTALDGEYSNQKISALCRQLVADGILEVDDVVRKRDSGGKCLVKCYKIITE